MTVSASPRLTTLYVCCSLHHFLADFSSLVDTLIYHTLICQRVWSLRSSSVSAVLLWTAISWSFGFKVLVPLSFSEINRCKMTNSIFAPFCKPHKMLPAFSNKSDHMESITLWGKWSYSSWLSWSSIASDSLSVMVTGMGFFFSSSFFLLGPARKCSLSVAAQHVTRPLSSLWHLCLQNRMWCWLSSCNFLLLLTHTPDGWVRCDRFIQGSWALREEEEDCLASVDKANIFNVYSH